MADSKLPLDDGTPPDVARDPPMVVPTVSGNPEDPTFAGYLIETDEPKGFQKEWAAPLAVLLVIIVAIGVFTLGQSRSATDNSQTFKAPALKISPVVITRNSSSYHMGFCIETQQYVVVSHELTAKAEGGYFKHKLNPAELHASEHMAAFCRLAQKHGENVTFVGYPLEGYTIEGKPVFLAKKINCEGEELILDD